MIIATAGHVDHGKTSLIKALTGTDTDRLPEEKDRGLTIDLGFAYAALTPGEPVGFVDVPGHERFIHNMAAGVGGVDAALMVVAADDGVMPQTREHLAILDLLGVRGGLIAMSKIDQVDAERRQAVTSMIASTVKNTCLENAVILPVSSITGEGIDALRAHITNLDVARVEHKEAECFRLAIDRRFHVRGAGLVVTGTVFSGSSEVDDRLVLGPDGLRVRIRGIHAQGRQAERAVAGQRCALNIASPDLDQGKVHRGQWLVAPDSLSPTHRMDGRLTILESEERPFKHWTPVHLHIGASDIPCRVATLGERSIASGNSGWVQLVLDRPICAWHGDRFVVRDQSARRTIGGGVIVDPAAPKKGRAQPERLAILDRLHDASPVEALANMLPAQSAGVDLEWLRQAFNMPRHDALQTWQSIAPLIVGPKEQPLAISENHWSTLQTALVGKIGDWHREKPDQIGPSDNDLARRPAGAPSPLLVNAAIDALIKGHRIFRKGNRLHLENHEPRLNEQDQAFWDRLRPHLTVDSLRPPRVRELAETLQSPLDQLETFLDRASKMGLVVHATRNRFFLPETMRALADIAADLASRNDDGFTAAAYRDHTEIGRNIVIELLEFFDQVGLTRRRKDKRLMRRQVEDVFGAG